MSATAATPRAGQGKIPLPAEANEAKDALALFSEHAHAAQALALLCADMIAHEAESSDGWQRLNFLEGFEPGLFALASGTCARMVRALDAAQEDLDRLAAGKRAVEFPTGPDLESAVAELKALLDLQANTLDLRKVSVFHLTIATGDKLEALFRQFFKADGGLKNVMESGLAAPAQEGGAR